MCTSSKGVAVLFTLLGLVAGTSPSALAAKCPYPNCDTLHWTACSTPGATTLCADWGSPLPPPIPPTLTGDFRTDLAYMEQEDCEHDEIAWASRVEPMLRFLWGRAEAPRTKQPVYSESPNGGAVHGDS